jgi:hypothetical protein
MSAIISDRMARRIASEWHSGQLSALLSLATTGAILYERTEDEILAELDTNGSDEGTSEAEARTNQTELQGLLAYVQYHGPRPPIAGWYMIRF